jgi:anthranilate phosphoribosyltransferase
MKLADALHHCLAGGALSREQSGAVFTLLFTGEFEPVQLAALLGALAVRGETADEIAGAVDALRGAMVAFEHDSPTAIDTCGTGGDGLSTFNLSTAAAVVAAAAGARVIKHGNRAASSRCGSADLLEAAGLPLELSPQAARAVLDEVGITFLYAPAYHPAMRHAAPVRRALGVRTLFNFLGPLANPGRVRRQLVGVGDPRRGAALAEVLARLGHERALVVHAASGADELTLEGENRVFAVGIPDGIAFEPEALGLARAPLAALAGGDARTNMRLFERVLEAEAGPLLDTVLLNSAAALVVAGVSDDPREGVDRAREAVLSGAARRKLESWILAARRAGGAR